MATSGSPTVRRRRLAAELRRLRGRRTGTEVSRALGWSPAKISRYELGRTSFPLDEVDKLLDFYGVTEPQRGHLMSLARDANQRGWWEDYADVLAPEYTEFIGLEAEAASAAIWQVGGVPGLLQTEEYARHIITAFQTAVAVPPSIVERRVRVRMLRQEILARDTALDLTVVLDEAVLLRGIGGRDVMYEQLQHIVNISELPNVKIHILPLNSGSGLMTDSFVIFGFSPLQGTAMLADVVSTETLTSELYVEGETDTYTFRLFFQALVAASLSTDESKNLIRETTERVWA